MYGLFDGDPDGIEILSCFKFGSRKQVCSSPLPSSLKQQTLSWQGGYPARRILQTGEEEAGLHVGRMEWLGVKPSEWGALGVDWDLMIPLTERDYKKVFFYSPPFRYQSSAAHRQPSTL